MWQADIDSNLASVAASQAAEARHQSDGMDQFHSDDFLLYAYLQSGQEARAQSLIAETAALVKRYETMPDMASHFMQSMFPYYRGKLPVFYALEMRDWKSAAALEPIPARAPGDANVDLLGAHRGTRASAPAAASAGRSCRV